MGGVAAPDDVAKLVRFLLSDDSRWITGQEIGVDGGHSLRRGPNFTSYAGPVSRQASPRRDLMTDRSVRALAASYRARRTG